MAEDRMLRAAMRESETVNGWPIPLRYFWTQLWGYCDSYGRGRRDPRLVLAGTFPLDEEVDAKTIDRWMVALETAGVIAAYKVGSKRYFECLNWDEHQNISYKKKTDIPDSSGRIPGSKKSSETFPKVPTQGEGEGEGEVEGEIEGERKAPDGAPTPFCKKHPSGTDSPCRGCGNARRTYDAYLLAEKSKPTPTPKLDRSKYCDIKGHGDYPLPCAACERAAELPEGSPF